MILKKQRYENGKREIYIFETKVFEYYADKLKKAKRCCDIPYKFLKRLYRENNFQIIHQVGVVISAKARIGNNCKVYQNTTIGEKKRKSSGFGRQRNCLCKRRHRRKRPYRQQFRHWCRQRCAKRCTGKRNMGRKPCPLYQKSC